MDLGEAALPTAGASASRFNFQITRRGRVSHIRAALTAFLIFRERRMAFLPALPPQDQGRQRRAVPTFTF